MNSREISRYWCYSMRDCSEIHKQQSHNEFQLSLTQGGIWIWKMYVKCVNICGYIWFVFLSGMCKISIFLIQWFYWYFRAYYTPFLYMKDVELGVALVSTADWRHATLNSVAFRAWHFPINVFYCIKTQQRSTLHERTFWFTSIY